MGKNISQLLKKESTTTEKGHLRKIYYIQEMSPSNLIKPTRGKSTDAYKIKSIINVQTRSAVIIGKVDVVGGCHMFIES